MLKCPEQKQTSNFVFTHIFFLRTLKCVFFLLEVEHYLKVPKTFFFATFYFILIKVKRYVMTDVYVRNSKNTFSQHQVHQAQMPSQGHYENVVLRMHYFYVMRKYIH